MAAIHIFQNFAPFSCPKYKRHLLVAIAVCTRLLAPKNGCPVPNRKHRLAHNIRNSVNHHQVLFCLIPLQEFERSLSEEAEDGGIVFRAPDDYAEEEEEVGGGHIFYSLYWLQ